MSDFIHVLQHVTIALHCPLCIDAFLYIRFWSSHHFDDCCPDCQSIIREWHIYQQLCPVQSPLPRLTPDPSDCQICHLKMVVMRQHFGVYETNVNKLCCPCKNLLVCSVQHLEDNSDIRESVAKKCKITHDKV